MLSVSISLTCQRTRHMINWDTCSCWPSMSVLKDLDWRNVYCDPEVLGHGHLRIHPNTCQYNITLKDLDWRNVYCYQKYSYAPIWEYTLIQVNKILRLRIQTGIMWSMAMKYWEKTIWEYALVQVNTILLLLLIICKPHTR